MSNYESNVNRINGLSLLEDGWLDGDGKRITTVAIELAHLFLSHLHQLNLPLPRIYPTVDGGVSFDWGQDLGNSINLDISDNGWLDLYLFTGRVCDVIVYEEQDNVQVMLKRLTDAFATHFVQEENDVPN